jgi:hypothetical protein
MGRLLNYVPRLYTLAGVWGVLFALCAHSGRRVTETSNRIGSILDLTVSHSLNRGFDAARQPIAVHSVRKPW